MATVVPAVVAVAATVVVEVAVYVVTAFDDVEAVTKAHNWPYLHLVGV